MPVGAIAELVRGDVFYWGQLMAAALLGSIPVAIIYSFFVEHYVAGLTAGGQGLIGGDNDDRDSRDLPGFVAGEESIRPPGDSDARWLAAETPVWFDFTDGKIRVNSALGRTKVRNMKLGAKVALSIMDPDNPDRYVQLRGTVTRVRQDDVAAAHIDQLAQNIWGSTRTPMRRRAMCA